MQKAEGSQNKTDNTNNVMEGNCSEIQQTATNNTAHIDDKVLKIMTKMGYKDGLGLGKNQQGIIDPVSFLANPGKCGFGLQLKQIDITEDLCIDEPEIIIEQKVEWLYNSNDDNEEYLTNKTILSSFIRKSARKMSTNDEVHFCNPEIVHGVFKAKGIFGELNPIHLTKARLRANPFEKIRSAFFMNRAALKIANIDAATDFMFTSIDSNPKHQRTCGPYYFADVCAGPGGFSEYILWKKQWLFKGFGFTLKNENDFKLHTSCCASSVTFQPLYGAKNDGNVCNPDNIANFKQKVLHETEGKGVHFMMSDGGFSVDGNEDLQEILSKHIYICQCLVALEIVRTHGHFVTKLFDVFTLFSAGLLFLMSKCFEKVSIFKPNASRPANSERYFICYGLKNSKVTSAVRRHMKKVARELWNLKDSDTDVTEIVPFDVIQKDKLFFEYLKTSNERIGERQIKALQRLEQFCKHPLLCDPRQDEIRIKCLDYWKIPYNLDTSFLLATPEDVFMNSVQNPEYLLTKAKQIHLPLDLDISNVNDWHFCFLTSDNDYNACHLFIGSSHSKSYKFDGTTYIKVKQLKLIPGTIVFGELVREKIEFVIENQVERYCLHVIDALKLGEFNVADLPFSERLRLIRTYCEATNHESRTKSVRIRPKPIYPLLMFSLKLPTFSDEDKMFVCDLHAIGFKSSRESYRINSILLLKTDEGQTFKTTYVLRNQVILKQQWNEECTSSLRLEDLCNYLRSLQC